MEESRKLENLEYAKEKGTSKERFMKALSREEPDYVPVFEVDIDNINRDKVTGRETYVWSPDYDLPLKEKAKRNAEIVVDTCKKLSLDALSMFPYQSVPEDPDIIDIARRRYRDKMGRIWEFDENSKMKFYVDGTIKTEEDYEEIEMAEPFSADEDTAMKYAREIVDDEMAVLGCTNSAFTILWEMMGMETFVRNYRSKRGFVEEILEDVEEYLLESIEGYADLGVDAIIEVGDYAGDKGPMFNPKMFREFILPDLEVLVEKAHEEGLPFIKHSDGDVRPILEDIVDTGIDGFHPNEPVAGMDTAETKEMYGDKIAVLGNIDCNYTLVEKSVEDTVEETKKCIKRTSPGGGHILSSSNSFHAGVKMENYLAMVDTAAKYGKYPISI